MSFGRWRQQLHVGLALRAIRRRIVTNIAIDLGYESPSAFIAMFRRMLGTTPARYLTETATDVNGGGKEDVIHICGDRCPHKKVQPADNVVPLSRVRNTN